MKKRLFFCLFCVFVSGCTVSIKNKEDEAHFEYNPKVVDSLMEYGIDVFDVLLDGAGGGGG